MLSFTHAVPVNRPEQIHFLPAVLGIVGLKEVDGIIPAVIGFLRREQSGAPDRFPVRQTFRRQPDRAGRQTDRNTVIPDIDSRGAAILNVPVNLPDFLLHVGIQHQHKVLAVIAVCLSGLFHRLPELVSQNPDNLLADIVAIQHPDPVDILDFKPDDRGGGFPGDDLPQIFSQLIEITQPGRGIHHFRRPVIDDIAGENIRFPVPPVINTAPAGELHIFPVLSAGTVAAVMILFPPGQHGRHVIHEFLFVIRMDHHPPDFRKVRDKLALKAEEFTHGGREPGHVGFQVRQERIVVFTGQAHGVENPVCQPHQVQLRSGSVCQAHGHLALQLRFIPEHHIIRDPQHIAKRIVLRIADRVTHRQLRGVIPFLSLFDAGLPQLPHIPDHRGFFLMPVDRQKIIPAHAVDVFRSAKMIRQQHGDMADVLVSGLMTVEAVYGPQIVDIDKKENKRNRLVAGKFRVIAHDIPFIAASGAQAAQRVGNRFPLQDSGRILQAEEEGDGNHGDRAPGHEQLFDENLSCLRQDQKNQHRHQRTLEIPAQLHPVLNHDQHGRDKINKRQSVSGAGSGTDAGTGTDKISVFCFQHRHQQHGIDGDRHGKIPVPFFQSALVEQVQRIDKESIGVQNGGQEKQNMKPVVHPGRDLRPVIHRPHGHAVKNHMQNGKGQHLFKNQAVLPHPVQSGYENQIEENNKAYQFFPKDQNRIHGGFILSSLTPGRKATACPRESAAHAHPADRLCAAHPEETPPPEKSALQEPGAPQVHGSELF